MLVWFAPGGIGTENRGDEIWTVAVLLLIHTIGVTLCSAVADVTLGPPGPMLTPTGVGT